jgi:hypothetical protein
MGNGFYDGGAVEANGAGSSGPMVELPGDISRLAARGRVVQTRDPHEGS